MSEAGNNEQNGQPGVPPVAFQQTYLAAELSSRVVELSRALAEKRAECLRLEGQIGEANYWLGLIRNAQPAPQQTSGAAPDGSLGEPTSKGE